MATRRTIAAACGVLAMVMCLVVPTNAAPGASLSLEMSGTFAPSVTPGPLSVLGSGTITGTFDLQRFEQRANAGLQASGKLAIVLRNASGTALRTLILPDAVIPVNSDLISAAGNCEMLHLDFGPGNLDLAGLQLSLSQLATEVIVDPTDPLARLICDIDGSTSTNEIIRLLNKFLGAIS